MATLGAIMAVLVVMLAIIGRAMHRELRPKWASAGAAPKAAAPEAAPPAEPAPDAMSQRLRSIRARVVEEALDSAFLSPEPPAGSGWAGDRDAAPRKVSESVSAVLRKQVPPRDEAPRSWLGGLPMMPADIEWPRGVNPEKAGEGEVPLHFIAQVACADLPPELWDGLGPREGWLLLFVNGNTCEANDRGVWRVLHVAELGEERQPPADIGLIHDGVYCGHTPWTRRETVFPRWPVDVVCVPNELRIEGHRALAAPENFAHLLYEGEPVADDGVADHVTLEPFTWRCLVAAIDETLADLDPQSSADPERLSEHKRTLENAERYRRQMHEKLREPGAFEAIVPALERNPRAAEHAAAVAALLAEHPSPDALIERLEAEDEPSWRAFVLDRLRELRAIAVDEGLDAPMSAEHWAAAQDALAGFDSEIWALAWGRSEGSGLPVTVERRKLSAMALLARRLSAATGDVVAACYADPARRGLIPADALEKLEPYWRQLYENRPHRMGGYHDGLQSDAVLGPTDRLLLLQFATDYAMQWHWGDNGAVYCFIRPEDLEAGAWDRAEFHLECH